MKETEQIRKAEKKDIGAVAAIYAHIHEQERTGKATIGWLPGIYPVRGTADAERMSPARKRKTVWGRGGETWFQRHC